MSPVVGPLFQKPRRHNNFEERTKLEFANLVVFNPVVLRSFALFCSHLRVSTCIVFSFWVCSWASFPQRNCRNCTYDLSHTRTQFSQQFSERLPELGGGWEFPICLVVSKLVVCNFYAEALFCGLTFALSCSHLGSFALIYVFL